jgi:hypothetical protein
VIFITVGSANAMQNTSQEAIMPVLMIALVALAVFGAIGILLVVAVIFESKAKPDTHPHSVGKPAALVEK